MFGHSDQTIRFWDVASGDEVHALLRGHGDSVWALAFSVEGEFFLAHWMDSQHFTSKQLEL